MLLAKWESFGKQVFGPSNYQRLKQSLNLSTTILPPDSACGISQFVSACRFKRIQTHLSLTSRLRSTVLIYDTLYRSIAWPRRSIWRGWAITAWHSGRHSCLHFCVWPNRTRVKWSAMIQWRSVKLVWIAGNTRSIKLRDTFQCFPSCLNSKLEFSKFPKKYGFSPFIL